MEGTNLKISLDNYCHGLELEINPKNGAPIYDMGKDAHLFGEARFQLMEGFQYDYSLNKAEYLLGDPGMKIIQPHSKIPYVGRIVPNIFVGNLQIPLFLRSENRQIGCIAVEVRSVKSSYREDYRDMLEYITEKCTDILLQAESPALQNLEVDFSGDSQSLYQKFAFVNSIVGSYEFTEAVHRIITNPVTKWADAYENRDIRRIRRFSNKNIKDLKKGSNRTRIPDRHYLRNQGMNTAPQRIEYAVKSDSVDTPENRFIKYALQSFLQFGNDIRQKSNVGAKLYNEAGVFVDRLSAYLHHAVFNEINRPATLKLNSPVLQRKEGYREILRVWLMFDLAAKLIWEGGEDVYKGGKKDVATLYEYWLFFKLLELFGSIFKIKPKSIQELIKPTKEGLHLTLKQGKSTPLKGIYDAGSRKFNVRFNFNRSFKGGRTYPQSGSWSASLRPDYTLSIWPLGITEEEAEDQELIVHVHFDAKYKISNLRDIIPDPSCQNLDDEKKQNKAGIYNNADLLKMHAYKDAIRRTGGAYVLYPGEKHYNTKGFHEIIPGLGAFPVQPSKTDSGVNELKGFILEVVKHFVNRASQREKAAYRTYKIHKSPPEEGSELNEPLPELYHDNRHLLPDETYVLVGYYKNADHLNWIKKNHLYNFRTGSRAGSLRLSHEVVNAEYLLLHSKGDNKTKELWRIKNKGPKIFSQRDMENRNYPSASIKSHYLVVDVEKVNEPELSGLHFDFRSLKNYSSKNASAYPFFATLSELMKNKVK
ncbi:hypothetical protein DN752_11640 [Echinicola strongylocentroti]|uniref:DUF2357 domain-containing protein n=1 Tax=Echinicola strongylocentroti TaxID=1795355 RepID=A0A2Z4IIF0_9BACT|nr:DUF2357 domain-containing protein [Echinicola strongylocentroti]AWW30724.1 hypothetical protein DN752_11640 [Echinicola strongylocentroti]